MFKKANFHPLIWFIMLTGLQSAALMFIWNHAVAVPFEVITLTYGQIYLILVGFRILFNDGAKLESLDEAATEALALQVFNQQMESSRFVAMSALLTAGFTAVIENQEKAQDIEKSEK